MRVNDMSKHNNHDMKVMCGIICISLVFDNKFSKSTFLIHASHIIDFHFTWDLSFFFFSPVDRCEKLFHCYASATVPGLEFLASLRKKRLTSPSPCALLERNRCASRTMCKSKTIPWCKLGADLLHIMNKYDWNLPLFKFHQFFVMENFSLT